MADDGGEAKRAEEAGEREADREQCGDERAEREQQDHQRDRHGELLRLAEVVADGLVQDMLRAREAELLDLEAGVRVLFGGDRVEDRLDVLARDLADLAHLELDERRVAVGGDHAFAARVERRADQVDDRERP